MLVGWLRSVGRVALIMVAATVLPILAFEALYWWLVFVTRSFGIGQ